MYYKIENKECEVYKKLHALRMKELQIEEENLSAIKEKIKFDFQHFLGKTGQQHFCRVTKFYGFEFLEPEKVDLKIWKKDKEYPNIFIPNTRTKLGKEMQKFLSNGLKKSDYGDVWDILELTYLSKFTFPFVEIVGDVIILYLDDNQESKDENVIEITKKEFYEITEKIEDKTK